MSKTTAGDGFLLELTARIFGAYVANNAVQSGSLPDLISSLHASVTGLRRPVVVPAEPLVPAVNPKKSVRPGYIVCLEDGKRYKSMKKHLRKLGLTPNEYRAKWGLATDYPMVAPNYAAVRSAIAKRSGLAGSASASAVKGRASADPTARRKAVPNAKR